MTIEDAYTLRSPKTKSESVGPVRGLGEMFFGAAKSTCNQGLCHRKSGREMVDHSGPNGEQLRAHHTHTRVVPPPCPVQRQAFSCSWAGPTPISLLKLVSVVFQTWIILVAEEVRGSGRSCFVRRMTLRSACQAFSLCMPGGRVATAVIL